MKRFILNRNIDLSVMSMTEIPSEEISTRKVLGNENVEWKTNLNREQVADFLISLGEQMKKGDEVKVKTSEWELPFSFREPIELKIDYEGVGTEKELEIEIELKAKVESQNIEVE